MSRARVAILVVLGVTLASAVISCEIEVPLVEPAVDSGGSGSAGSDGGFGSDGFPWDTGGLDAGSGSGSGSGAGSDGGSGSGSGSGADAGI